MESDVSPLSTNIFHYRKGRISILLSLLRRGVLFILVFILCLHFTHSLHHLSSNQKEQVIKEIQSVLERYQTGLGSEMKEKLAMLIYDEACRYQQDPKFILAIIAIESEFKNWSVSHKGAKGLMQIMPYVAQSLAQELGIEWKGDHTLFNPYHNIRIGTYYLSQLISDFKDIRIALTAYNYGPTYIKGLIERRGKIPSYYYRKFLTTYRNI